MRSYTDTVVPTYLACITVYSVHSDPLSDLEMIGNLNPRLKEKECSNVESESVTKLYIMNLELEYKPSLLICLHTSLNSETKSRTSTFPFLTTNYVWSTYLFLHCLQALAHSLQSSYRYRRPSAIQCWWWLCCQFHRCLFQAYTGNWREMGRGQKWPFHSLSQIQIIWNEARVHADFNLVQFHPYNLLIRLYSTRCHSCKAIWFG